MEGHLALRMIQLSEVIFSRKLVNNPEVVAAHHYFAPRRKCIQDLAEKQNLQYIFQELKTLHRLLVTGSYPCYVGFRTIVSAGCRNAIICIKKPHLRQ